MHVERFQITLGFHSSREPTGCNEDKGGGISRPNARGNSIWTVQTQSQKGSQGKGTGVRTPSRLSANAILTTLNACAGGCPMCLVGLPSGFTAPAGFQRLGEVVEKKHVLSFSGLSFNGVPPWLYGRSTSAGSGDWCSGRRRNAASASYSWALSFLISEDPLPEGVTDVVTHGQ